MPKHVCKPPACPCACATSRRKKRTTKKAGPPRVNPLVALLADVLRTKGTSQEIKSMEGPKAIVSTVGTTEGYGRTEPVRKAVIETQTEPVRKAVIETQTEPVRKAVIETQTEPVRKTTAETQTLSAEEIRSRMPMRSPSLPSAYRRQEAAFLAEPEFRALPPRQQMQTLQAVSRSPLVREEPIDTGRAALSSRIPMREWTGSFSPPESGIPGLRPSTREQPGDVLPGGGTVVRGRGRPKKKPEGSVLDIDA